VSGRLKFAGRDVDIVIVHEKRNIVLCLEVKNMQSPRSFTDYRRVDGRTAAREKEIIDGAGSQ